MSAKRLHKDMEAADLLRWFMLERAYHLTAYRPMHGALLRVAKRRLAQKVRREEQWWLKVARRFTLAPSKVNWAPFRRMRERSLRLALQGKT